MAFKDHWKAFKTSYDVAILYRDDNLFLMEVSLINSQQFPKIPKNLGVTFSNLFQPILRRIEMEQNIIFFFERD